MKSKILKSLFVLIFVVTNAFGQLLGDEEVDEHKIVPWNVESFHAYEGVYFFGFSEGESKMTLSIHNNTICVQLKSYTWVESEHAELTGWHPRYLNYTNVKIKGNKFYSNQSNGEFVVYDNQKCLKLYNPPTPMGEEVAYELGLYGDKKLSEYYGGRFTSTIFKLLQEDDLNTLDLEDLQIMRNEIFARYHYIFKTGGKMDTYFKAQHWYSGLNKNVDALLTEIEKENIRIIQKVERQKRKE